MLQISRAHFETKLKLSQLAELNLCHQSPKKDLQKFITSMSQFLTDTLR